MYATGDLLGGLVSTGAKRGDGFDVQTEAGELFKAPKLVFATGIKDMMPPIAGFADCWGISVLHCPYCHGYEVRHQKTGILANGDAGLELSSLISNWTKDLTLYTNGQSTLTKEQEEKLHRHKIPIVETEVERLEHKNGSIENIVFKDGSKTPLKALYARLSFEQHSLLPQALGCEITDEGFIKIDASQKTTVAGVFACGDNVSRMRTVANAVSMGTATGLMLNRELIEEAFD